MESNVLYKILSLACLLIAPDCLASIKPPVIDGEVGLVHVYGSLTESPCHLETTSAWQTVYAGNAASAQLHKAGDRGQPVTVQFRLKDCQAITSRNRDDRSDSMLWSNNQPAVTVNFTAPADRYNTELIAVTGATGIGLRMTDAYGRDIRLGSRGSPLLLNPGQDTLVYNLSIERTSAPLRAGAWRAMINVGLEYD